MLFIKESFSKCRLINNIFRIGISASSNKRQLSENIFYSPCGEVTIPDVSITEWIYTKIEPFYKHTAVECVESGKKYTFEQVRVKARNLSKALRKYWSLNNGDVIAIYSSNCPDFFVACLGVLEAGLVITTVNSFYKSDEISKQLLDSSAKIIITQPQYFKEAQDACRKIKRNLPIITIKIKENGSLPQGAVNFEELINIKVDIPDINTRRSEDLAFLPYSSGTTGVPKGVEITHKNLVATSCQNTQPDFNLMEPPTDKYQEVVPGIQPLYHIYGFATLQLNSLATGIKVLSFPKFSPELFISALKNYNFSIIYAVPPLVIFMNNYAEVKNQYLSHLKFVFCGAAPLGILDEQKFKQKVGHDFYMGQGYGMTETTGIVTSLGCKKYLNELSKYQGSVGVPVPSTLLKVVKIGDPSGTPVGPNEQGEILVKGPQVMKGYLNNEKETKESFSNGWLKSGDMGKISEDGMLYITDRLKEMIKVKGFQVAPAELEELLRDCPYVEDVAVIGVPHPTFGEVPRAYVAPKKDSKKLTAEYVEKYIAEKVAKYKHLIGGVQFVDNIPKSASGKILRKQLKMDYEETMKK